MGVFVSEGQFKFGAYGVVFLQKSEAVKVFLKRTADAGYDHAATVYESEVEAHLAAGSSNALAQHVPRFEGEVQFSKVLCCSGRDITEYFYPDLAYRMERIQTGFMKAQVEEPLLTAFHKAGVFGLQDVSVAAVPNRGLVHIDFSMCQIDPIGTCLHQPAVFLDQ